MRLNLRTCIGLVIALAVTVALLWHFNRAARGDRAGHGTPAPAPISLRLTNLATARAAVPGTPGGTPGRFAVIATNAPNAPFTNALAYRLTNTAQPLQELLRSDTAVLLRNALIDTTRGTPEIPAHLRASGEPGAYVVQARGVITDNFRRFLQQAGAEIVSYVPNNAYLVRASAAAAQMMKASPLPQAVLPFEPYYKFDSRLLALAVNKELSPYPQLNVVAFPGTTPTVRAALDKLGVEVLNEPEPTAFGDVLVVKAGADQLTALAQVGEVQMLGVNYEKVAMNDLTRVLTRVSTNIAAAASNLVLRPPDSHYAGPVGGRLTGNGVLVAVADTGVDENHPDLAGRVFWGGLPDYDGHGTHVIGTIIGDGASSPLPPQIVGTNSAPAAFGSRLNAVFAGMAPQAQAFVQYFRSPDAVLQSNTALTNALISNNSWGRPGDNDYDIFAASYDAAVRDSLPGVTGEQQVTYVFAAGNEGGGSPSGLNGIPGSIVSPATAKNVITVGASDLPRFITNRVSRACVTDANSGITTCETNQPWIGMTETNNQVSPYSSRGNVGIGIEGTFGRFKPDVIAPGSMVVSTRSKDYLEPTNSVSTSVFQYNSLNVALNQTNLYALFIPPNAVSVTIATVSNVLSPADLTLWIGADIDMAPGAGSLFNTNLLTMDPTTTPPLRAGTLYYTVANTNHSPGASFDLVVFLTVTNDVGDYFEVLKQLNEPLKPHYRYEAGTSMAAPAVSGFLALIQQYLRDQFQVRPSPALLKAMVINGARSISPNYNLQINAAVNHQGWGLVNMSNSLPAGFTAVSSNGPVRIFDQSVSNALATGEAHSYVITVPAQARSYPLRATLVWTDPPGNPITGVKLVNDLNLAIYGSSSNAFGLSDVVYAGNNFPPGSDFSDPFVISSTDPEAEVATNWTASLDYVNNVENVFIRPPLAATYTVVVKGHRVNVNAVNSHLTSHAQDYALVIASGNVASNAAGVNLAATGPALTNDLDSRRISALVRATNATTAGLLNQRVGANNPLIVSTNGATNQWCFFTYTNVSDPAFRYVAVLTFFAPELSLPRFREADIDLYVARGAAGADLFANDENLRSAAIAGSTRSTTRLGTELVGFSNALPDEVFYIGVKSEDQQAANFNIFAASSDRPFSDRDASNNIVARALPLPAVIPDGSPDQPGGTNIFMIVFEPDVVVQRAYLTNRIFHEVGGDLIGILSHVDPETGTPAAVTLNNHRSWTGLEEVIYDDSDDDDLTGSIPPVISPDGPGSLRDFIGQQAFGVWNFSISDNALFHTGLVEELTLILKPASTNADQAVNLTANIVPDGWLYAGFRVPADATNVEVCVSEITPALPVEVYIRHDNLPTQTLFDKMTNAPGTGACMDYGLDDTPPLSPGRYFVGVRNPNPVTVRVHLVVTIERGLVPNREITVADKGPTTLIDDATTNAFLFVTNRGLVTSAEIDVRINHPRVADLALHLVNPVGTRLLLAENRGRDTTNGYGVSISNVVVTNFMARVLDDGFEYAVASAGPTFLIGAIVSGWRVDGNDIDLVFPGHGMAANTRPHSGTNAIDLSGFNPNGAVSTNVATTIGKTYLLSFAYTRNPGPPPLTPALVTSHMELDSVPAMTNTYDLVNAIDNLMWLTTSLVFRATSTVTKVGFRQIVPSGPGGPGLVNSGGMFIDTVRLDEVEISTNSTLYATFTDDTLKAPWPIKFAPPPFGDTNFVSTNVFISGFEGTNGGFFTNTLIYTNANLFTNGESYDGWLVKSNRVYVHTNSALAYSGTNFLALRTGTVTRLLPTVAGKEYVLQFATKVASGRVKLYNTGVDDDDALLPNYARDPHWSVPYNTVMNASHPFPPPNPNSYVIPRFEQPGAWSPPNSTSQWISPYVNPNDTRPPVTLARVGDGYVTYRTTFNMSGAPLAGARIRGRWSIDNYAVSVLNGVTNGIPSINYTTFDAFTITNGFLPGLNTLDVVTTNEFGYNGIRVEFTDTPTQKNLVTAIGEVKLVGSYTNYFVAGSDQWRMQSVKFVARSNSTPLEFTGVTQDIWLDHVQMRETGRKYYQPEEPLTPLVGQPSYGNWKLEIWDSRLSAAATNAELVSWRVNLNLVRTNPPFVRLTNDVAYQSTIDTNALRYFAFDVPCAAGTVTNSLRSLTPPYALDLVFNQATFPLTGSVGDFPLLINVLDATNTMGVGSAPLLRNGRYYLAVRNTNNVPVDFIVQAGMSLPCGAPFVSILKPSFGPNGFTLTWLANPNEQFSLLFADDPAGPWAEIIEPIVSQDGQFIYTDDGMATGGLPERRFYQLRRR